MPNAYNCPILSIHIANLSILRSDKRRWQIGKVVGGFPAKKGITV